MVFHDVCYQPYHDVTSFAPGDPATPAAPAAPASTATLPSVSSTPQAIAKASDQMQTPLNSTGPKDSCASGCCDKPLESKIDAWQLVPPVAALSFISGMCCLGLASRTKARR